MEELLGNKIKRLIKENGYAKINDFHKKIREIYSDQAVARFTLTRIIENKVHIRPSTLKQIATALMMPTSAIRKGTDAEDVKEAKKYSYRYSGGSTFQVLEKNLPFVIKELLLKNNSYKFLPEEFQEAKPQLSTEDLVEAIKKAGLPMPDKTRFRGDFNKINYFLRMKNLYTNFPKLKLPPEATSLLQNKKISANDVIKLNRIILETAFPNQCPKIPKNRMQTDPEKDDPKATESLKWVFVMKGKINLIFLNNGLETRKTLTDGQGYSFDARQLHCFENIATKTSRVLIIHYPAANNIFYEQNALKK